MSTFALAACGIDSSTPPPTSGQTPRTSTPSASETASETASALPRIDLPVKKGGTVEGLVDVDGHDIYTRCSGTGSPTVVYFTGWAPEPSRKAFVRRWSPGVWESVSAPHWMDEAAPDLVVETLERVIALAN